jgi:lipoprotein NlpI
MKCESSLKPSRLSFCAGLWILSTILGVRLAYATVEDEAAGMVDHFYNLEFDRAQEDAAQLEMEHPSHPAGAFYNGVAIFQQYLLEYPPQESTLTHFEQTMQRTLMEARALEATDPALSHYYQGAALGFLARVAVARHRYAAAIPKARQGRIHLEKAIALDPHLEDAYMGLGMYDYFADRMPAAVKPFAYLMMGMWGNRERGLKYLNRTREYGHAARMEATSILAAIYASQSEKRWEDARPLFSELSARYPKNPRYRLGLAYVLQREGRWADALEVLDRKGTWLSALHPLARPTAEASIHLRAAENLLFLNRYPEADQELKHLEISPQIPFLADWLYLRRGNWLEAMGRKNEAAALYEKIRLKKPAELAVKFLKTPFPDGPRDVMPNRWPLPVVPE